MRKQLRLCFALLMFLFSGTKVFSQSVNLTISGENICYGDQFTLDATINGATTTQCRVDWDGDGNYDITRSFVATTYSFQNLYSLPGPYTIKVEATLQGGGTISTTQKVRVYRLPIPAISVIGSATQCFRGNKIVIENQSIKTDNKIYRIDIDWRDSRIDNTSFPVVGQRFTHTYNAPQTYSLGIKVTDSLGCFKDTIYPSLITIKNNIAPDFMVSGRRSCDTTEYVFSNTSTGLPFSGLNKYTWDFGDGKTITKQKPWSLPFDSINYDTIHHKYVVNGSFFPSLTIEDTTGCIDSFRFNNNSTNIPQNIVFTIDPKPYLTLADTINGLRRDSVCFGNEGFSSLLFKQTPNDFVTLGNGELTWDFGDPPSLQKNKNIEEWTPSHTFVGGIKTYKIKLTMWPNKQYNDTACLKTDSIYIDVIGPQAKIEDPNKPSVIAPNQKNQCAALASGYYNNVSFVNNSSYGTTQRAEHVFTRWDFDDAFAPQCTSYSIPNPGYPPPGGFTTASDMYTYSTGYWRQHGNIYVGKRIDCKYSADSLPIHQYRDWDVIYKWHRYGHDFMPWDNNQYTRNPADTLPSASPRKTWVTDADAVWWGKPIYLNPATGNWDTIQRTWVNPLNGISMPFPRIDTIKSLDANGQPTPNDLKPYARFTLNNGAPDPFSGFTGGTGGKSAIVGYGFIPIGKLIDPLAQNLRLQYSFNNKSYSYSYDTLFNENANYQVSLYQYLFNKAVVKCYTVALYLKDSQNNVGNKTYLVTNDFGKLDSMDCMHEANVTLNMMKPDARGLGKSGKECPGSNGNIDRAGVTFNLGPIVETLGQYPGISPTCGQAWIRFNFDSLADRLDRTPCALDGFVNWSSGPTLANPQPMFHSTTPGGLFYPAFSPKYDWGGFINPQDFWSSAGGTSFIFQYGPGSVSNYPDPNGLHIPSDQNGNITVGLIVGTGDPLNPCLSDTIWYHNFLTITDLDGRFYLDPTYDAITNVPTNGVCKYYCKDDMVNFVYIDSVQKNIKSSTITWGDNTVTVDSFYYADNGVSDGYFVNGFRRVRYQIYFGECGQYPIGKVYDSIVFPNGLPGARYSVKYTDDYTRRLFNSSTNRFGSLIKLGKNTAGDSTQWQECGRTFWVANNYDTIKRFYLIDTLDFAKMLLPVQHKYWLSSYEVECRKPGSVPRRVQHDLLSLQDCKKHEEDTKLLVRGVIDSVWTNNSTGVRDSVFCKNEPVYFYDSIRYWRPDCQLSNPTIGNNNFNPVTGFTYPKTVIEAYYHFDTVDYWTPGSLNPNDFKPNGSYVEKVKYYFGDGDSANWTKPVHKYKSPGVYTVTLLSRDKNGCWDTTYTRVIISEPIAQPVVKPGLNQCGAFVTIYDRSTLKPVPGYNINAMDSIKFSPQLGVVENRNFWWFGERSTADTLDRADAYNNDTAEWQFRNNGNFRVKLVVESAQGCKDTGFINVYISGPRPKYVLLSDTIGCAPFTVKVVNLQDVEGGTGPNDKPTARTDIMWGDLTGQTSPSIRAYDTLTYTYLDSGTFYIFSRGDDNNPQSDNFGCRLVYFPDTTNNNQYPIKVKVLFAYPAKVEIDKQIVCVDQPFLITNLSDTASYTQFKYTIWDDSLTVAMDSIFKSNKDLKFTQTIPDTGNYKVLLTPTAFAPGLPMCPLTDTADITVVKPYASFKTDTSGAPNFVFTNTSVSAFEYTWTAYKDNQIIATVDKVQSDRDWSFNFGKDTGDVIICLEAFTQDPAKPICVDKVCDTISYRFVVEMEIFNVFTPGNNDGKNDVFDIKIKGETKYDLVIYNRWGNKVFESTDAAKDWDGTNQNDGTECPAGTYFYVFKYELKNGEKKTLNGSVTLIRQ